MVRRRRERSDGAPAEQELNTQMHFCLCLTAQIHHCGSPAVQEPGYFFELAACKTLENIYYVEVAVQRVRLVWVTIRLAHHLSITGT